MLITLGGKLDCPSGQRNIATAPVRFATNDQPTYKVTAAQGTDTAAVMAELGYSENDIRQYMDEGAVRGKTALK